MEEQFAAAMEGFENVWSRVQSGERPMMQPESEPDTETRRTERLLAQERAQWCLLGQLERSGRQKNPVLRAQRQMAEAHIRALQAEYFVAVGDSFPLAQCAEMGQGVLSRLRQACLNAAALARDYDRAEAGTGFPALCGRFAAEERRSREALAGLLAELMR